MCFSPTRRFGVCDALEDPFLGGEVGEAPGMDAPLTEALEETLDGILERGSPRDLYDWVVKEVVGVCGGGEG